MEPNCRSRHGQSYASVRRRISRSVAHAVTSISDLHEPSSNKKPFLQEKFDLTDDANEASFSCRGSKPDLNVNLNKASTAFNYSESIDSSPDLSSYSSDSDSDADDIQKKSIREELVDWAINLNISHSALRSLLSILKPYHPSLPADPRTLLKTSQVYTIKEIACCDGKTDQVGQYYHFGIGSGILQQLQQYKCISGELSLQFNFDGLPLFKSSSMEFWPILCLVKEFDASPFVVGLYCGSKKPSNVADYVHDFVVELQQLFDHGFVNDGNLYKVKLDCFVCDAPARSFIKNVKSHTGYFGCDKCTQEGEYLNHRMTFPVTTAKLRTDADFREMIDDSHHRGPCPLSDLPIGLVTSFVFDYMHLVCLGVVRKLIKFWISGSLHKGDDVASRLSANSVQRLSARLVSLQSFVPCEFARRPRALSEIDRWKATEFRQFLLYTGPIVLPGILSTNVYNHFMLLSAAITILVSPSLCQKYTDYAKSLLVSFVESAKTLYGQDFIVYNVHGLIHLADDVSRHGSLDSFSAFPFENELKALKRLVRKAQNPLAQCIRRLSERRCLSHYSRSPKEPPGYVLATVEHYAGPIPSGYENSVQFLKLKTVHFRISIKRSPADCCVVVKEIGPVLVLNLLKFSEAFYLVCQKFGTNCDIFSYPLASSHLGVQKSSDLSPDIFIVPISDILCKCACFGDTDAKNHYNVFPIVHTTDGKHM